jgi:glycine/D-amino acid oxidase-like deaminating enzyme|tara:strand:+ start:2688 stop:4013 length:1326 start_codon:yes stop_codon:yes gene_type:complete
MNYRRQRHACSHPDPWSLEATLWAKTAPALPKTSTLCESLDVDVAIVGGGFTGVSSALHLAEVGTSVAVLEAEEIGWGCSSRNEGNVAPSWWGTSPDAIISGYGEDRGERMNRLVAGSGDLVSELVEKHSIECEYRKKGVLWVAENEKQMRTITSTGEQWARYGHRIEPVTGQDLPDYIATERYVGGTINREYARINPAAYVRGLARAALAAGARIFTGSRATAIEKQRDRWRVSSAQGEVIADQVIIGTNSHSGALWPLLSRSFYPATVAMFASEPYADGGKSMLLKDVPFHDSNILSLFGVFFDEVGRLLGGIVPPIYKSALLEAITRPADLKFARIFPQLPLPIWRHLWIGTMCMMPDGVPRVYRLAPGVYSAMGYSGSGICPATAIGRELAKMIVKEDESVCAMPISEVKALPFARLIPLLMRCISNPIMRLSYRFN